MSPCTSSSSFPVPCQAVWHPSPSLLPLLYGDPWPSHPARVTRPKGSQMLDPSWQPFQTISPSSSRARCALNRFDDPKVLPCLHTFCRRCLEELMRRERAMCLHCPTCKQEVPLSHDSGVDCLPSNFFINNILDVVVSHDDDYENGVVARAEPLQPRTCSSCDEGSQVTSRCQDCNEHLCDSCVRAHQRVRLTKDHFIVRLAFEPKPLPVSIAHAACLRSPAKLLQYSREGNFAFVLWHLLNCHM